MQRPLSQAATESPVEAGPLIFRALLVAALVAAFAQITLGGFVRVLDAGLACGDDWPLCDGQWIPAFTKEVVLEYTHRLAAVLLGIFVLAALVAAWRVQRGNALALRSTFAAFALVIAAGGFGWATVASELGWGLRLIHLALAELLITSLVLALVAVWPLRNPPWNRPAPSTMAYGGVVMTAMLVTTFIVLVSGSVVVGLEASTACGSWPLCSGSMIIPSGDHKFAIHMIHRIVSVVAGLLIVWAAVWAWRMREWWPGAGPAAVALAAVVIGQIFVGAANPWSAFAPGWKAIHVALATATWMAASVLTAVVHIPRTGQRPETEPSDERFRGLRSLMQ